MSSILSPFLQWTERNPDKLLYTFLDVEGRTTESYSYAQFLQRTTDIASYIRRTCPMSPGERVLLAYPPGLEMICAFFACVRLGLIPVPVYPPTSHGFQAALDKTDFIARDCQAAAVLTERSYYWSMKLNETRNSVATLSLKRSNVSNLRWIVSTDADTGARADFPEAHSDVLFLQYTSGSTSEPKGVMVTHDNILENCESVVDHRPIGVSWLPQYHDMGLIGYYIFFALKGGTTYGFAGGFRAFEGGEARLDVRLLGRFRWRTEREWLRSVHGPAIRTEHGTYALRFAGMGEIRQIEQFYRMNRARTLDELAASVDAVTLDQLNDYLRTRDYEPCTVASVGPVELV